MRKTEIGYLEEAEAYEAWRRETGRINEIEAESEEPREHECWRMLQVWPRDDSGPEKVQCFGCGAVGRIEWEYKP